MNEIANRFDVQPNVGNHFAWPRSGPFEQIAAREKPLHTSTYLTAFIVMLIGVAAFVSVFARF